MDISSRLLRLSRLMTARAINVEKGFERFLKKSRMNVTDPKFRESFELFMYKVYSRKAMDDFHEEILDVFRTITKEVKHRSFSDDEVKKDYRRLYNEFGRVFQKGMEKSFELSGGEMKKLHPLVGSYFRDLINYMNHLEEINDNIKFNSDLIKISKDYLSENRKIYKDVMSSIDNEFDTLKLKDVKPERKVKVDPRTESGPADSGLIKFFKDAEESGDEVSFDYTKADGSTKRRTVVVTAVYPAKGRWAIKGKEGGGGFPKMFYLDGIKLV